MIQRGIRRFDLYDFFSVFLPGATFLIGLFPFVPNGTSLGVGIAGVVVVLGFVVGRAIHGTAIIFDGFWNNDDHRDVFLRQISDPTVLSAEVMDQFFDACCEVYNGLGLCETRRASVDAETDEIEPLYTLVRSYVHMDSRGRSRTFQAVYAFHRSMWFTSLLLGFVYYGYALLRASPVTQEAVAYQTYISSVGLAPEIITAGATVVVLFSYRVFRDAKRRHQRHYVQYLISDFLTLYETETMADGDPTVRRPPVTR